MEKKLVVGLEVGSSKVLALVGEVLPEHDVNIIGRGQAVSKGVNKGAVNDLESVVKAIQLAISQAEEMADCEISSVHLALSGQHIKCQNEIGQMTIGNEEVNLQDIEEVIYNAKSIKIPNEHRLLHAIPQDFIIDEQEGIRNPVGLSAVRLKANVHLITCHNDMAKNIIKAVEKCNIKVDEMVFSGLASSYAVATEDEKDLGVCVIDMGADTMDITVYTDGYLRSSLVIPYSGNNVTRDIAYAFRTPFSDAEQIKIKYGSAFSESFDNNDVIEVPSVGGRPTRSVQRKVLSDIIEPRYVELFTLVRKELISLQKDLKAKNIKHQLAAGVILTGGAAQIKSGIQCAEKVFKTQVRIGYPIDVIGLTDYVDKSDCSTAVGLLHYAKRNLANEELYGYGRLKKNFVKNASEKINKWVGWVKKEF